jgi:hypothetical protein
MTGFEIMNKIIDLDLLDAEVVVLHHETRKMSAVVDVKRGSSANNKKAFIEYEQYHIKKEYPQVVDNRHKRGNRQKELL